MTEGHRPPLHYQQDTAINGFQREGEAIVHGAKPGAVVMGEVGPFLHNSLEVEGIVGEEGDAAGPVVEAGRDSDDLPDAARMGGLDPELAGDAGGTFVGGGKIDAALFGQGIEADIFPVGQGGFEAAFGRGLVRAVIGLIGEREVGETGREDVGAERRGDAFFKGVEVVEIGCDDDETEIRPGEHGEGKNLGLRLLTRGGEQGFEVIERDGAFIAGAGAPDVEVDAIKEVEDAKALAGPERLRQGFVRSLGRHDLT